MPVAIRPRWIWTDEKRAEAIRLYVAGHSCRQVAAQIATEHNAPTRNAVIGLMYRSGIHRTKAAAAETQAVSGRLAVREPPRKRAEDQAVAVVVRLAPVALATPPEPPPIQGRVYRVEDLTHKHCKWPIGEPGQEGFAFCGRFKSEEGAYCTKHHKRAYQAGTGGERGAKDLLRSVRRYA